MPTTYLRRARQTHAARQLARVARRSAFDPNDALLICSSPRGGSSWLAETLRHLPDTALLWEPLHLRKVPMFREAGFNWHEHVPENAEWEGARQAFERLLRGNVLNAWLCRDTHWRTFAKADRLLVKFVRAHALLPWLTKQFAFRHRPVFLIRHPFAVTASQLLYFNPSWEWQRQYWRSGIFAPHREYLETLTTWEEVFTARWCITTLPTLRHPANNKRWITVTYEGLLTEPARTLERILNDWRIPPNRDILDAVHRPSSTTETATFLAGVGTQLRKWQNQLSLEQVTRMQAVLDHFGVACYDDSVMPLAPLQDVTSSRSAVRV